MFVAVDQAAARHGIESRARSFSIWSHLATMIFVQLAHALSLNDVCDWLRLLSPADKGRFAAFVDEVLWKTLAHLRAAA